MVSFDEVMGDIQQATNVTATIIPGGQMFMGSHAVQNQTQMIGALGGGIGSIFGGVTGAAGDTMNKLIGNPMVWVGGGILLLMFMK